LDEGSYPTGRKVTDEQMQALFLENDNFHRERNDTLLKPTIG
jgi:hypothetical protein